MAEISVKISEINAAIDRLQALRNSFGRSFASMPAPVGGGMAVGEMQRIAEAYRKVDNHFSNLLRNTVLLLTNIRDSYAQSDSKAAQGIKR